MRLESVKIGSYSGSGLTPFATLPPVIDVRSRERSAVKAKGLAPPAETIRRDADVGRWNGYENAASTSLCSCFPAM
jgi:hypothetical protein